MSAALFFITTLGQTFVVESWSAVLAIYLSSCLWILRGQFDNERILSILAVSGLGVVYLGFFPAFAIRVLNLEHGGPAFFSLLIIVFAGDTFAILVEVSWAVRKLMESVSPKKTWSEIARRTRGLNGWRLWLWPFCDAQSSTTFGWHYCHSCGLCGQSGDLFVSLTKRVAPHERLGT